ncbi:hypothetical protein A2G07_14975 (plasmid) [Deinococcus radiodurans R1 = ATCC 13939 = DSM 20539]|nr:hypothetical protein A2G07_14975 [Deinococcus radiodurans R1 = ATCC 13939 = DSM 20539]
MHQYLKGAAFCRHRTALETLSQFSQLNAAIPCPPVKTIGVFADASVSRLFHQPPHLIGVELWVGT